MSTTIHPVATVAVDGEINKMKRKGSTLSEQCEQGCSGCEVESCTDKKTNSFLESPNKFSNIGKVIGVVSGKGGVGKTLVTSLLAVSMQRAGYQTAILDADVTGPSVPRAFGVKERVRGNEFGMLPAKSKTGISIMSTNLLLENDTDPVISRGPIIAGTVKQFWTDVVWGDIDYMFVDLPPGTGDVPLTVFQTIPLDGIVIVTLPQKLVGMIVEKAVNMAARMDIPVLALVENLSYFKCPDCEGEHTIFGESHVEEIAEKHGIDVVCKLPINPQLAAATDAGTIEMFEGDGLNELTGIIEKMEAKK